MNTISSWQRYRPTIGSGQENGLAKKIGKKSFGRIFHVRFAILGSSFKAFHWQSIIVRVKSFNKNLAVFDRKVQYFECECCEYEQVS